MVSRGGPRLTSLAAALTAATLLAGCGGDDGGGGEASFDEGAVELAEPGSARPLGERAFVEYAGLGPNNEPTVETTLGVTVREVNEGDSGDIEGLGEGVVPWYVHVEYENHGENAVAASGGPGGRFTIRGSDGEEYDTEGVISIGGEFEPCPRVEAGSALEPKQAVADCVVITLSEGATPEEVRFEPDYADEDDPVGWTID